MVPHRSPTNTSRQEQSPTTDRSCLSTPFDSSVSNASPNAPPTANHFPRFSMVLLDSCMVLFNFSVVLLDFSMVLLNFSFVLLDFSMTPFSHSFTPFSMVYPIFTWFYSIFPWIFHFYSTSPQFYPSIPVSPNAPRRTDQGGIDTPPSPNCHLVHNPQKSSNWIQLVGLHWTYFRDFVHSWHALPPDPL